LTDLVLGIDIGTASSKATIATADGDVRAVAAVEHPVSSPRPGWYEHDPETAWWSGVLRLLRELPSNDVREVAALGVSGIGPCLLPCDANDRALRPAILYGIDTRATSEVGEIAARLGKDAILERCGSRLSSQSLGPKLAWLRAREPQVFEAMRRWHMASSFVVARLTGEWVLDHHSASQCDPLYELEACSWIDEWVDSVVPGLPLPPLRWPSEVVGTVTPPAASTTGLRAGVPVVAGTVDAWAEAVSAGVRKPGSLMLQYGSTLFLILQGAVPHRHPSTWTTRSVDPDAFSAAAGLATGGLLVDWAVRLLGGDRDALTSGAATLPPGANGLLALPYFAGERTPIFDPSARGVIAGLTLRHGPEHVFRALLEATAYAVRHNLEALADEPPGAGVAVGGGTASSLWLQIVSDATGLTQTVPTITIGASYGMALLAAEGAGLAEAGISWARPAATYCPAQNATAYEELFEAYMQLYPTTRSIQHRLANRQLDEGSTR